MAEPIPPRNAMQPASQATTVAPVEHSQAPGVWSPAPWFPLVAAIVGGALVAVGPLLVVPSISAGAVMAAVISGIGSGVLGYFGIKSAGTHPKG